MSSNHNKPDRDYELRMRSLERYTMWTNAEMHIIEQHGTWAITQDGMISLTHNYFISRDSLLVNKHWPAMMQAKTWHVMADFMDCYHAACRYHTAPHPPNYRYSRLTRGLEAAILKRDQYLCVRCFLDAKYVEGQVFQRIPEKDGGSYHPDNLWVLCSRCAEDYYERRQYD